MSSTVINVCFHGIGTPRRELEPGEDKYWVSAEQYDRILDEVSTWPAVSLSFDDANVSDVEAGLPGLRERGLTATFFLLAGRIDQPGSLSSSEVLALSAEGMSIGSHGMWHRPWRGMSPSETATELVEARSVLAELVGKPIEEAALPLGRYDRRLLSELKRLDYGRVYSSDRRKARSASWFQPRFSVTVGDTVESLRRDVLRGPGTLSEVRASTKGLLKQLR